MTREPVDAEQRARARGDAPEDRRGTIFVEASAGTGKTSVLVERVVNLIAHGDCRVDEIAVVTFTELAAAELEVRVRERLEERLAAADSSRPQHREHLARALDELDDATIGTIHAFAADLLRRYPIEAGIDPGFGVADELGQRLRFAEAWEEFLRADTAAASEALEAAFDLGLDDEGSLRELAFAVAQAERQGVFVAPPLGAQMPAAAIRERLDGLRPALDQAARLAISGEALHRLLIGQLLPWFAEMDRRADDDLASEVLGSAKWPRRGQAKEAGARDLFQKAHASFLGLQEELRDVRLRRVASWLGEVGHRYLRRLSDLSLLDFDQLLEKAAALLREHEPVRRELASRYRAVLVDEFQDTDRVQTELLLTLAGAAPGRLPARDDSPPRSLFVVGDPKQSIYRFRRADIENYRSILERPEVERLELSQSFRSTPRLAEAINAAMSKILPREELAEPWEAPYRPLRAPDMPEDWSPDALGGVVYLDLDDDVGEHASTQRVEAVRAAEARGFARLARHLVEGPASDRARVRDGDRVRPATYGDLTILLPRFTNLGPYEDALAAEGVPFRVEAGRSFYRRDEVHALLHLLAVLADPGDSIATIAVLRGPGFGCSDEALVAAALLRSGLRFDLESASTEERAGEPALIERSRPVFAGLARLSALRTDVAGLPLGPAVALAIERCHLWQHFALVPRSEQRLANLAKAIDVAERLESQGVHSLTRLSQSLRVLLDAEIAEAESLTHEGRGEALRVLTVHGAKGLEFPVVMLGGLAGREGSQDRARIHPGDQLRWGGHKTSGLESVEAEDKRRDEAEERRLLYVAMTRARDLLVLSHSPRAGLGAREMVPLYAHLYGDKKSASPGPGAPDTSARRIVSAQLERRDGFEPLELQALVRLADLETATRLGGAPPGTAPAPRDAPKPTVAQLSTLLRPSRGTLVDGGHDLPAHPNDQRVPWRRRRESVTLRAQHVGIAAHALLAQRLGAPRVDERLARFGPEILDEARQLVQSFAKSPLEARAFAAPGRLVEEPVTARLGPRLLDGRLDLAFLEGERWVVVDFKTDRVEGEEAARRAAEHAAQLALYAHALESATGTAVGELQVFFLAGPGGFSFAGEPMAGLVQRALAAVAQA